jgi:hypothetical protein
VFAPPISKVATAKPAAGPAPAQPVAAAQPFGRSVEGAAHPSRDFAGLPSLKSARGQASDPPEVEADRVAEEIVGGPNSGAGDGAAPPPEPLGELPGGRATSGRPLTQSARDFFEPRFGYDFSKVRLHADEQAAASARDLGARAYARGHDIVFGASEYDPDSSSGRRLLAHELAHVVQQSASGVASIQRKEVDAEAEIKGPQDWTTSDREAATPRWAAACKTNLDAVDSTQYVRIVERRDFYKWFYHYAAEQGFTTRWALAAYAVANGAHQIADMDESHDLANSALSMANVELEGAMREGNQVIFDNVLPKLKKLIDGKPLKGRAALEWDSQVLADEQALVQPMYKALSPDSVKQMDYIAKKTRFAWLGAKAGNAYGRVTNTTTGDYVAAEKDVAGGVVPEFPASASLQSVGDRWQYGMGVGNTFTPGGTNFTPGRDKMPSVAPSYASGAELAKVDTRRRLHELDAWLNPHRADRVGPGADYKAIIAGLSEAEKKQVASDRSPDGWAYSTAFAQFGFIEEADVRNALPSDPAFAPQAAAFLARFAAERRRVQMRYPSSVLSPM